MLCVAGNSGEGWDRASLHLDGEEALDSVPRDRLNRTVVVALTPGAFVAPWAPNVPRAESAGRTRSLCNCLSALFLASVTVFMHYFSHL